MHRILFHIGTFPIYSFGVMVAIAVMLGSWLTTRNAHRIGLTREQALEVLSWVVGLGVLFSRLAFVVQNLSWYLQHPNEILDFRGGGMSWHGCIIGLVLAVWLQARRVGVGSLDLLDLCAPGSLLGLAIGRIGCFLNGCCFGRECSLPWAVYLPDEITGKAAYRHPSPLYEMTLAFIGVAILQRILAQRRFRGQVFWNFLLVYSIIRFIVEFFRQSTLLALGLSLAQWVSIGLMIFSAILLLMPHAAAAPTSVETPPAPPVPQPLELGVTLPTASEPAPADA
jgi:phosphatidylglycerol:prolipoprotein diacylglycerol transferase